MGTAGDRVAGESTSMKAFHWAERLRSAPAAAWSFAVAAYLAALLLRFATDHQLPVGFPYLTFFPAVILTTFFAGFWPGVVCALLSGLSAWYWFIPPPGEFSLSPSVVVALLFYVGIVGVDILLIQGMHRAVASLRAERGRTQALLVRQQALLDDQQARVRQQHVLQRELSHRMKNTLAMVQAVVSQSLRNSTDTRDAADKASARIQALARTQDTLTATDWAASDVASVVAGALEPHRDGSDPIRCEGPAASLDAQRALGLALAIHELATNAAKYGALSVPEGRVAVEWGLEPGSRFWFEWRETGGPAVEPPTRHGFGTRLTERIVPGYFGGTARTAYEPKGITYRLDGLLQPGEGA